MGHTDRKYAETLALVRACDNLRSPEFIAQVILSALASLTASIILGLWLILVWWIAHYAVVMLEKWVLMRYADHPSRRVFYAVLGLNFLAAAVFIVLPVSLWYMEGDVFQYAAMALLTAATLNTVLIRTRVWQLLTCYLATNGFAFAIIAVDFWRWDTSLGETISATVVMFCVLIYFLVSTYEANRLHRAHHATTEALARANTLEAIGQFSEGIAHDFNNVLSVVIGNLDLLQQPENPYDDKELREEALEAARRGAKLAAQLQALGRGKETAPVHVDVSDAIAEIARMLQRVLPSNIRLNVDEDDFLPTVFVDETMLSASLLNLGLNARDAMSSGGEIVFEARRVSAQALPLSPVIAAPFGPASFVCVRVSDTGKAMTEAEVKRITSPFAGNGNTNGSSLGLTMIASFVQRHQGTLAIDSVPGQGNRISIYLPVYPQAALSLRRKQEEEAPDAVPKPV